MVMGLSAAFVFIMDRCMQVHIEVRSSRGRRMEKEKGFSFEAYVVSIRLYYIENECCFRGFSKDLRCDRI